MLQKHGCQCQRYSLGVGTEELFYSSLHFNVCTDCFSGTPGKNLMTYGLSLLLAEVRLLQLNYSLTA